MNVGPNPAFPPPSYIVHSHHHRQHPQPHFRALQHCPPNNNVVFPTSEQPAGLLPTESSDSRNVFLINAHRVGMRAMDTMGQRSSDEGNTWSFMKYSKRPSFSDDICWLFEEVAVNIGPAYVHSFCEKASACLTSPFLLLHFAKESIKYFRSHQPSFPAHQIQQQFAPFNHMPTFNSPPITSGGGPNNMGPIPSNISICGPNSAIAASGSITSPNMCPYSINTTNGAVSIQLSAVKAIAQQVKAIMLQQICVPHSVADLMRHTIEMIYGAAYFKLNHTRFNEPDIDDICELTLLAREAFGMLPTNTAKPMFDTFLRFVRKQKMCKKDVSQRITNCLQN
ncbi:zinc finger SWIM domain-containing protein 8 [Ditylenchus destructor]|uniref:Zinc finger SWIM domain-containing protein 8 n=1 Tax=Ditylenchus destructor TaxID=166010 RepID=A0AAD4R6H4_9BILA|nr:zinc finger SWIM domain-containing protein 8 [Ditylenchus destructor]